MPKAKPINDEALFPSLEGHGAIALDCETYDPDLLARGPGYMRGGFICGVAIGTEAGFRQYYPIAHEEGPNLDKRKVLGWLKKELGRAAQPKIGGRLLYDYSYLDYAGVKVAGPLYDIQVAEPLLDENQFSYGIDAISKRRGGTGKHDTELDDELKIRFGRKKKNEIKSDIWRLPGSIVGPYAIRDIALPLEVFPVQRKELEAQGLWDLFLLESKLIPILAAMHRRGVRIDLQRTEEALARTRARQAELQAQLNHMAGYEVAVWAADSIKPAMDNLGIKYPMTPKTGKPSITKPYLERLDHPIAELILEVRGADKMCGTFFEGCLLEAHHEGRIHCQFNQLKSEEGGTVTGRFSSSRPNLQFIPKRTEEGRFVRTCFIPDEGEDWGAEDYSQIEYRLITHDAACMGYRGAEAVVQAYHDDPDTDFHREVAIMMGYAPEDKQGRSFAKTINFGLAYGEGVDKLCRQLGMTREAGEAFLNTYHAKAPFIRMLTTKFTNDAATKAEVVTLLGRKRRFDTWEKKNWQTNETTYLKHRFPGSRRAFTHKALNARIQGGAADIMKLAMVQLYEAGIFDVLGAPLVTVHDELDWSVPRTKIARQAFVESKRIMENVVQLKVPLRVDAGFGPNWGDVKDVA